MIGQSPDAWGLRDDLGRVLAREVSSWASRSARLTPFGSAECTGYTFVDRPSDDRGEWRLDASFFGDAGASSNLNEPPVATVEASAGPRGHGVFRIVESSRPPATRSPWRWSCCRVPDSDVVVHDGVWQLA